MGAESDREAWSSVGGRWRVAQIRYPRFLPPGYGRHPGVVLVVGLLQLGAAMPAFWAVRDGAPAVLEAATDFTPDQTVPAGFRLFVTIAVAVIVGIGLLLVLRGTTMVVVGATDLVRGRRTVEGRVLRVRRWGGDDRARWYVAVDDGAADRIRAWRTSPGLAAQGCTARASVGRWLSHVREFEVVSVAPELPFVPDVDEPEDAAFPLGLPAAAGAPPPLPDAATVSACTRRSLADPAAPPHPLAVDGASVTFRDDEGASVQAAWVDPSFLQAHRALPRLLRRNLPGVGDEAYRAVIGGAVVARHAGSVLLVMGRIPGADDGERDRAFAEIARAGVSRPAGG
ncbi:MAG: hypothetical protein M3179_01090 [Actinomycetota bacterium]|nr:hypothetical protein [Actinomycetota bacterium]